MAEVQDDTVLSDWRDETAGIVKFWALGRMWLREEKMWRNAGGDLMRFWQWCRTDVGATDLVANDIDRHLRYLEGRGYAPRTLRRSRRVLDEFFRFVNEVPAEPHE